MDVAKKSFLCIYSPHTNWYWILFFWQWPKAKLHILVSNTHTRIWSPYAMWLYYVNRSTSHTYTHFHRINKWKIMNGRANQQAAHIQHDIMFVTLHNWRRRAAVAAAVREKNYVADFRYEWMNKWLCDRPTVCVCEHYIVTNSQQKMFPISCVRVITHWNWKFRLHT